jgi:threonyl-tRNA synthetase
MKVPYMPVVGDREVAEGTVALRKRDGTRADGMGAEGFVGLVVGRIASRSAEL